MKHLKLLNEFINEAINIDDINLGKSIHDMDYFQPAVIKANSNNKNLSNINPKPYYINRKGDFINQGGKKVRLHYIKDTKKKFNEINFDSYMTKSDLEFSRINSKGQKASLSKNQSYNSTLDGIPFVTAHVKNKAYSVNLLSIVANTFPDMLSNEGHKFFAVKGKDGKFYSKYTYSFLNKNKGFDIRQNIVYRKKTRRISFHDDSKMKFFLKRGNKQYQFIKNEFLKGATPLTISRNYRLEFPNEKEGIEAETITNLMGYHGFKFVLAFKGMFGEKIFNSIYKTFKELDSNTEEAFVQYAISMDTSLNTPEHLKNIYKKIENKKPNALLNYLKKHSKMGMSYIENMYVDFKKNRIVKSVLINNVSSKYKFDKEALDNLKITNQIAISRMLEVDLDIMNARREIKNDPINTLDLIPFDMLMKDIIELKTDAAVSRKYFTTSMSIKRRVKKEVLKPPEIRKVGSVEAWDELKIDL